MDIDYINEITHEWPVSYAQIVALFPNTSFAPPDDFTPPEPYKPVVKTPAPAFNAATQIVRNTAPVLIDGAWTQQWAVIEIFATQEERDASIAAELAAMRANKNSEINAERERRTFDTFTHAGKVISCDTLSRSDIDGINGYVALNGAFPDVWPGAWKCADNSYLTISTVDEWKAFYGSMVAAGAALYAHAQELKAALAKAATVEEIAAIVW